MTCSQAGIRTHHCGPVPVTAHTGGAQDVCVELRHQEVVIQPPLQTEPMTLSSFLASGVLIQFLHFSSSVLF